MMVKLSKHARSYSYAWMYRPMRLTQKVSRSLVGDHVYVGVKPTWDRRYGRPREVLLEELEPLDEEAQVFLANARLAGRWALDED